MQLNSRRAFIKKSFAGGLGLVLAGPLLHFPLEKKTYKIDCHLPRFIFQNSSKLHGISLTKVIDDTQENKVLFVLSDGQIKEYRYADSFSIMEKRGGREGMKLKILLSYSLYKMCSDNRRKEKRKAECSGDQLQRQKFLEALSMDSFAGLLESF